MEEKKNLFAKFKEIKEGKKGRKEGDQRDFVNKILSLRFGTGKHLVQR